MLAGYDILYGHNRCAWLKARRINRFRAFLSPDFFICTIDAKGPFKPCYRIQTCYRPELTRNSTLSSKGSCWWSRNSGFFAKINITNFQALFFWFCQTYGTALFSYTESMTSGDAETAPPLFCVLGGEKMQYRQKHRISSLVLHLAPLKSY